jgi:hypothetical protein
MFEAVGYHKVKETFFSRMTPFQATEAKYSKYLKKIDEPVAGFDQTTSELDDTESVATGTKSDLGFYSLSLNDDFIPLIDNF